VGMSWRTSRFASFRVRLRSDGGTRDARRSGRLANLGPRLGIAYDARIFAYGAVGVGVAEEQNVSDEHPVNPTRRVSVGARVPPDVAQAVRELADAGNRTVSREIARAIEEHLEAPSPPPVTPERGATTSSSRSGELPDAA
jgi:hypothetical protein